MYILKCSVFGFAKNLLKFVYIINILQCMGYSSKLNAECAKKKKPQPVALGENVFFFFF